MPKLRVLAFLLGGFLAVPAYAEDLVQVYRQALTSDPTFLKAQADWLVARMELNLAKTGNGVPGSGLFPNFGANAAVGESYQNQTVNGTNGTYSYDSNSYQISLTQPVFNWQTWKTIGAARFSVKAATATYLAAAQDLMTRTSNAYFEVLRANELLILTIAQKKEFWEQLVTARQKFKVGLIAVTGVYNAQASYDTATAVEIAQRNTLHDRLEDLRLITGKFYRSLGSLKPVIPLKIPQPENMEQWVLIASKQNYSLQAALNAMLAAHEQIGVAAAGQYPSLDVAGSWGQSRTGTFNFTTAGALGVSTSPTKLDQGTVGLQLNVPLFRGGFDQANTKQARYNYLSASDQVEVVHRTIADQTRQAFLGVDSGISKIEADQQAVISAKNQVDATEAGYLVGTRTMVDLLNALTQLTQAQQSYADDRYNYVESIIALKEQAGTLSPNDIGQINSWLGKEIIFSLKQPTVKPHEKLIANDELNSLGACGSMGSNADGPDNGTVASGSASDLSLNANANSNSVPSTPDQQPSSVPKNSKELNPPQAPAQQPNNPDSDQPSTPHDLKIPAIPPMLPAPVQPNYSPMPSATSSGSASSSNTSAVMPPATKLLSLPKPGANQATNDHQDSAYVIQLFSDPSEVRAKAFLQTMVKRHPEVAEQLQVLHKKVQNKSWYQVGYGQFATMADAKLHFKEMPPEWRKNHAWVVRQ